MSLFKKSILFLLSILSFQLAMFLALGMQARRAEQKLAQAAYSNKVLTGAAITIQNMDSVTYDLALAIINDRKPTFVKRYEKLKHDLPVYIEELKQMPAASEQDKRDIKQIDQRCQFFIEEIKSVEKLVGNRSSPLQLLQIHRLCSLEVVPHVCDLEEMIEALRDRHRYVESDVSVEEQVRNLLQQVLVGGFALCALTMIITVIGFSRQIIRRLALISDNFARHGAELPLNPVVRGNDEIAALDKQFHFLSQALSDANAKDKAVFSSLPVGLITFDSQGKIDSVNPRARELVFSESSNEHNLRLSNLLADENDLQRLEQNIKEGKLDQLIRAKLQGVKGGPFPAELTMSSFQYRDKTKYLLAFIDVSAREQVEKLRQELVAIVSHDLRTPLTSIRACLNLAGGGAFGEMSPKGRELFELAERESDRLITLTSDLLDMARIEAGTISMNLELCDVQFLMERAAAATAIATKHARIEVPIVEADLSVTADADRSIQILVNYISNAIKYSPAGSRIQLCAQDLGMMVRIQVLDEGRGIPAEKADLIFDRFEQVEVEDKKIGTGLGLSICKLFAEAQGGAVGVLNREEGGSIFYVDLPKASDPDQASDETEPAESQIDPAKPEVKTEEISKPAETEPVATKSDATKPEVTDSQLMQSAATQREEIQSVPMSEAS